MRELNIKEMESVSGGFWNYIVGYVVGKAIDSYIDYAQNPTPVLVRENDGSDPLL